MERRPSAICLMGPSAAGKTRVALRLVQSLPCEIISVDSVMVYQGLDVGTDKPDPQILREVPHWLIDICDPADAYSAGRFREDARAAMAAITARGRIPLLVGGTTLYFRVLREGLSGLPAADPVVRARIDAEAERHGWQGLYRRLAAVDPEAAGRIHPNDPIRIQRALEIYTLTGQGPTELFRQQVDQRVPCDFHEVVLAPGRRSQLHERIAQRFQHMLDRGLVAEVAQLRARGDLVSALPAIRAVGYRQVWQYLEGEIAYQEMIESAIIATRQLAKRQMTGLRALAGATWFDSAEAGAEQRVLDHLGALGAAS